MNDFPIGWNLSLLYRAQQLFLTNETKDVDIGGGQLSFVFALFSHPACSQDDVARILELDKTTVARAVLKMEKSGIIERKRDSEDQRVIRLYLTKKGVQVHSQLKNVLKEWHELLVVGMSEEDLKELEKLFNIMSKNAMLFKKESYGEKV